MRSTLEYFYQLGGGDKSQVASLIPSYYNIKKMMKNTSKRIENLLRLSITELIKKNCIFLEIDGKTIGKMTADVEESRRSSYYHEYQYQLLVLICFRLFLRKTGENSS
jgi:hypothetical protein